MRESVEIGRRIQCSLSVSSTSKSIRFLLPPSEPTRIVGHLYEHAQRTISHQPAKLWSRLSGVGSGMTDRRRPDGSYGPEYGPLPPEHEYAMYHHLSSRRRAPWLLHHGDGDYPGRILEQRLRQEPFGLSRHPLQPYAPFRIRHASGITTNPRHRREDPGLTDEEFREAMDQLRKQEYKPSHPQKKRHHRTRSARAEAPPAVTEEEKACTICLETFLAGEQVVATPCNHMFHHGCITPWVKGHGTCPVCRSALCERRNAFAGNINSSNGSEDGALDLDLLAMMRAMEETFSRVRLSDSMSYHH